MTCLVYAMPASHAQVHSAGVTCSLPSGEKYRLFELSTQLNTLLDFGLKVGFSQKLTFGGRCFSKADFRRKAEARFGY
jgi:hypothetical protein